MPRFKTTAADGTVLQTTRTMPTGITKAALPVKSQVQSTTQQTKAQQAKALADAIKDSKREDRAGAVANLKPYTGVKDSTIAFLVDLAENNKPSYLKEPKVKLAFNAAQTDFYDLTHHVIEALGEIDSAVKAVNLNAQQCIYRIYRDTRFGGLPYKEYFAALLAPSINPRKSIRSCYYLQIQPGGHSVVGGGLYNPVAKELKAVRTALLADSAADELRGVLKSPRFKKLFGEGLENNDKSRLKSTPRGYSVDMANIDLIRYKSFTVFAKIDDSYLGTPKLMTRIVELLTALHPFNVALDRLAGLL